MVDLHVHSCRSDGTLTPTELVDYAMEKGLKAFALTDHDSVEGISEATDYAERLRKEGKTNVPEIIPGIEVSCQLFDHDVHIVGLYVNPEADVFKKYLSDFVASRDSRNIRMCERMTNDGIIISYDELKDHFPDAVITRAHYAALLVEKGYVKSKTEAFERYIGDRCPYYIPRQRISPEEGVKLVLAAGGIPVLAHPILYRLSDANLENLVKSLKESGLVGIEAVYSTYSPSEERQVRRLAQKYSLRLSGGSDFHGTNKDNIDLGCGRGSLYIDDSILTGIKEARHNLLFTDLDGTLLLNDSSVSSQMHEALKVLTERGHKLIFASGRPLPSILERIETYGLNFSNTYIIANNGGIVYDLASKNKLLDTRLSSDVIKKVVALADEAKIHAHAYTDSEIVGTVEDEELRFYMSKVHMPFIKVSDMADYLSDGTYKIQLIHLTDHKKLEELQKKILEVLGDEVSVYFSTNYYLEVLPAGVDKGNAVLFLTDALAMPRSHTFAAGDMENDIPMIKAAEVGIAMKNADEKVKAAADLVTTDTNDNNGLIEIINQYFV